jgi:hypothetical protein
MRRSASSTNDLESIVMVSELAEIKQQLKDLLFLLLFSDSCPAAAGTRFPLAETTRRGSRHSFGRYQRDEGDERRNKQTMVEKMLVHSDVSIHGRQFLALHSVENGLSFATTKTVR